MERNENEWNVNNLVWEQHGENGIESFYDNITIRPLFWNKELNIQGYFGSFSKEIIKSNFIPSNSSQFQGEWKFEILRE